MTTATYRRPPLRIRWWVDRLLGGRPGTIQAETEVEAEALRSNLLATGVEVLPRHWTSVGSVVTVRRRDLPQALDRLEEIRSAAR